jgi:hypothetical protein
MRRILPHGPQASQPPQVSHVNRHAESATRLFSGYNHLIDSGTLIVTVGNTVCITDRIHYPALVGFLPD